MTDEQGRLPEFLVTDDGARLEASWTTPAEPSAVAVLTHPHPRFGGDMHNLVPAGLARALPDHGVATLRFNFRGTGRSTGTHGGGRAEVDDVHAALDVATSSLPGLPVLGIGYSFGADVLLAVEHGSLAGVVAVAPPLSVLPLTELGDPRSAIPTLVLSAEHDQFRSFDDAAQIVSAWPNTTHGMLAGTDHFLAGALQHITDHTVAFLTAAGIV